MPCASLVSPNVCEGPETFGLPEPDFLNRPTCRAGHAPGRQPLPLTLGPRPKPGCRTTHAGDNPSPLPLSVNRTAPNHSAPVCRGHAAKNMGQSPMPRCERVVGGWKGGRIRGADSRPTDKADQSADISPCHSPRTTTRYIQRFACQGGGL